MTEANIIRTIQDIERIEQVPLEQRLTIGSTYEMLERGAAINPNKVALYFFPSGDAYDQPVEITYRAFIRKIRQTANLLHDLGIGTQDVVSFLLPNLPQTHYVIWGGEAVGIVNAVNHLLEPAEISAILRAANTKILVALGPSSEHDIWEKVEVIRREVPTLEAVLQVNSNGDEAQRIYAYDKLVEQYPDDRLVSGRIIQPDDIAAYFHTGGTTGTPKIARHMHRNQVFDAWVITLVANTGPQNTLMCGLPLFHVNAVHTTGLAPFSVGASVVLLGTQGYRDKSVIKNFWKIAERYRATSFTGVPTLLAALLHVPLDGADISSLKTARVGAAPMPVEIYKAFEAHAGFRITEGYGLTEGTCSCTSTPREGERRIGSIGLRYPYQQIKVVKLDERGQYVRDCAPDEIGHLVMKGPQVFAGYLQPEHNEGIWVADGWLNTGDMGRQDRDGFLWLTGRAKDVIIRGGHNIDPAVIEEAFHRHEAVALAAAVGKPDGYAGELPVAYVQLKPGMKVSEAELLDFVRDLIPERAAVPKAVHFLDEMPQTAIGKIFKPELRFDAIRRAYLEALSFLESEGLDVQVEVGRDPMYGALATITIEGTVPDRRDKIREKIDQALNVFTVRYDLKWCNERANQR